MQTQPGADTPGTPAGTPKELVDCDQLDPYDEHGENEYDTRTLSVKLMDEVAALRVEITDLRRALSQIFKIGVP